MESTGREYKNHYVTILNWYEKDKDKFKRNNYTTNYEDSDSV